ncbi:hypothetical protein Syun_013552 [Stephania yunnanensis]|uniref:RNase H type-1 domain-containing protein n=1 Tax=Stephania yunnanensis TaxID=152371 RepID=A0AAP0JJV3_9MAGN
MAMARSFRLANKTFLSTNMHKSPHTEHLIGWRFPPRHWVKVNTDGAVKGEQRLASAGVLIRNDVRDFMVDFVSYLGISSVFEAELWKSLQGLQWAWNMGFSKVILEVDNISVVDLIAGKVIPRNLHRHLLYFIQQLLGRAWEVHIVHTVVKVTELQTGWPLLLHATQWGRISSSIALRTYQLL